MCNQTFKSSTAFLVLICVLIAACKKSTESPQEELFTLRVAEYKTGMPVQGATVQAYYAHPDYLNTILDKKFNGPTDSQGEVDFDSESINLVRVSHQQYWTNAGGLQQTLFLIPIATLKYHLVKSGNYDEHAGIELQAKTTETFNDPLYGIYLGSISLGISYFYGSGWMTDHLPADTVLYVNALGNCNNYTSWNVFLPDDARTQLNKGETAPEYINRFDTLEIEINY